MCQIGGNMKKFSILILVFLFLSCGNGGKHIADNDSSAENPDTDDIEISDETTEPDQENTDMEDIETTEDEETTDYDMILPDEDEENSEEDDTEPFQDPCLEEPCKSVENSTSECLEKGKSGDYICVCKENFVWFPNKKTCEPVSSFKGLSCTGQTKCYDNEKEIPCPKAGEPFFGQDANHAEERECIPQNFTIKLYGSDKTVIDNNSKLEWVQEVARPTAMGSDNEAVNAYSDWRHANFFEYNSIIDSGTFDPVINEAYFPDTPSIFFRTGSYTYRTPYPPTHTATLGINFKTGLYQSYDYDFSTSFRYVRNLPEKPKSCTATLQNDEFKIVTLFPQKLLFLKTPADEINWEESLAYCEDLTYSGISDWRLPNRNEAYFNTSKAYNSLVCWSSTTYTGDPTKALFYLSAGNITTAGKITGKANASCCVAFDPCPEGEMWNGKKCVSSEGIAIKDDECGCIDGYEWEDSYCIKEEYIWEDSQWVKRCSDELCNDKPHSTGVCLKVKEEDGVTKVACRCAENYFLNSDFECVNPCDADPCSGKEELDGSCVPTGLTTFTCGCNTGYYASSQNCVPVTNNDCYIGYSSAPCVNDISKIMWSSTSNNTLKWDEARQYCEDLEEAHYTDWRLPKVEELWTFAKSCTNIPKESCEASESSGCLSEECLSQCACQKDPAPDYSANSGHWSSSFNSDDPEKAAIFSTDGYFLQFRDIKTDVAKVKCVRNIE